MLNEYLPYELLKQESIKRNYLLTKVEIDENWKGGNLVVPFKGGHASSFKYGGLTDVSDVSENKYVRGGVSTYKEIWGTMKFNARDLMEHDGSGDKVSEQSFLNNLPGTLEDFIDDMKQVVSVNLLNGTWFATLTADATANDGLITVDHPERFTIGQKVVVKDGNSTALTGYATNIDVNTGVVTLVTARGGSTAVDFSALNEGMTVAQSARCYVDGADTAANAFTSLKQQLLSAANGGDTNIFGVAKSAYPFLQATQYSGSSVSATTLLDTLFDFITKHRQLGRGTADEFVMSYKHLGTIMKSLETKSGPYRHVDTKASMYGWTTITIMGVKGEIKVTAVQEMDNDVIYLMDWRALKLHTNQMFKKYKDPEGKLYYTVRNTDGYVHYVDICLFGELVVSKPNFCGVLYGIPNY